MSESPAQFAERVLDELNDTFKLDADYIEALEEIIDRAQGWLDAKNKEDANREADDQ